MGTIWGLFLNVFFFLQINQKLNLNICILRSCSICSFVNLLELDCNSCTKDLDKTLNKILYMASWYLYNLNLILVAILLRGRHLTALFASHSLICLWEGPDSDASNRRFARMNTNYICHSVCSIWFWHLVLTVNDSLLKMSGSFFLKYWMNWLALKP